MSSNNYPSFQCATDNQRKLLLCKLPLQQRKLLVYEWLRESIRRTEIIFPLFEKENPNDIQNRVRLETLKDIVDGKVFPRIDFFAFPRIQYNIEYVSYYVFESLKFNVYAVQSLLCASSDLDNSVRVLNRIRTSFYNSQMATDYDIELSFPYGITTIAEIYEQSVSPEIEFNSSWRTSTAINLAEQIIRYRNFSICPILADALQDAGFDYEPTIAHLQQGQCYSSDWIFAKLVGLS